MAEIWEHGGSTKIKLGQQICTPEMSINLPPCVICMCMRNATSLVPSPLHNVPFQHGLPSQNPSEAEPMQIQSFKVSI